MKLIFLCGCIEPGHDGVGDYTRSLAAELIRQGNYVTVISLNDPYTDDVFEGHQRCNGLTVSVVRIPSKRTLKERLQLAKKYIDTIDPAWLSLQFVVYSFHPKGLPFALGKKLKELGNNRRWHIMFHELWIGFTKISPWQHRITGFFQKKITNAVVRELRPEIITTSNRLYQLLLRKNRLASTVLPLFSSIPVALMDPSFALRIYEQLPVERDEVDQFVFAGIFGNLYPDVPLEEAIAEQARFTEACGKKLAFIGFGRINDDGLKEFRRLETIFFGRVKFLHLGALSEENVSNLMQMLDVAFSCTPSPHIGKSSVFAALKLHRVNVLVPKEIMIPEYHQEIKKSNEELVNRPASDWSVGTIANRFSALLNAVDS